MMLGRLLFPTLIILTAGCIASATPTTGPTHDATPSAAVDETLRVTWTDAPLRAGDTLTLSIDAPMRWPAPHCMITQHVGRSLNVLDQSGGTVISTPASERDGGYACDVVILDAATAITFSVTRPDDNVTRIHGPHHLWLDTTPRIQRPAEFASFTMETTDDGLPLAAAAVPLTLANIHSPGVAAIPESNGTFTWIALQVITPGLGLGDYAYPTWTSATTFEEAIDIPARIHAAAPETMSDHYILAAYAHASNDRAFALSEPIVRGYGTCADGSCLIRDG